VSLVRNFSQRYFFPHRVEDILRNNAPPIESAKKIFSHEKIAFPFEENTHNMSVFMKLDASMILSRHTATVIWDNKDEITELLQNCVKVYKDGVFKSFTYLEKYPQVLLLTETWKSKFYRYPV